MCIISSKLPRVVIDVNSSFMFFFAKSLVLIIFHLHRHSPLSVIVGLTFLLKLLTK